MSFHPLDPMTTQSCPTPLLLGWLFCQGGMVPVGVPYDPRTVPSAQVKIPSSRKSCKQSVFVITPHSPAHLESCPGGVRGADESLHQVVLGLGLHLGQGPPLGDTELEGGQPVGGSGEVLETLGGGHRPAGGAGGGGDALEGVGCATGDRVAGEEREEAARESTLGGTC